MPLAKRFIGISPVTAQSLQGDYAAYAAAGSGQSDATLVGTAYGAVTSGTGGVRLTAGGVGDSQVIFNTSGSSITVYPATGFKINQFSANTGVLVANNTVIEFYTVSGTQIFANQSA